MLEQLTLIEAGAALGISPDAVRMRVKRGSLQGEKDAEGRWLVWVDVEQAAAEREAEREPDAIGERDLEREPEQGEPGAEALRAQIEALEERIGELKEERDFLRRQVDTLIFAQGMAAQKALPNPARRSWWARLVGGSA